MSYFSYYFNTYFLITLAVSLTVLSITWLVRKRREKKAAAAAAASGGEVVAPGGDEISVLIHEAEQKLAAAKLEQGGKVSSLPVFLVVGEPGTTKTSVMLHSGLEPELLAGQVYQAGNVAPTRTANFWFSRRAIFAEAGGGMIADGGRWGKLVKKLQPKAAVVRKGEQAPRAALVCFDCENFTKPGSADIVTNAARTLRARLGEISQAMGINLPIYALFTKTDRLPFFTDFVRNLTNDESTQVLGVTLPMVDRRSEGIYAEEETTRLTGQFERLFRSLADARIEFLAREGDANKLPTSYEFPREFRKVRPALVQFLVDLCRPSQLTVGPFLRGFYFTGVRPVIINEMAPVAAAPQQPADVAPAGATGIFNRGMLGGGAAPSPARPQVIGTRKVPQWLFLSHLFNDILLMDRSAMGASGASTRTSAARRWLFIGGSALCFLLLVMFTISFFNNRGLENDVRGAAEGISSVGPVSGDVASLDVLNRLETLRVSLATLRKYHIDGAPWLYRWFLYIGEDLYRPTRAIYFDRFKQAMFGQTQGALLANLKSLPPTTVPEHDYGPTYDSLKAYLMTTSNHEKTTKLFLAPTLMAWWMGNRQVDPKRVDLARRQFDFYAEELKEENPYSSENDTAAVERARRYLKQFEGIERVYNAMLSEADTKGNLVNFNHDFPGSAAVLINSYEVRAAFTAGGRKAMSGVIAHADQYYNGETWVLGEQSAGGIADRAQLERDLRVRYDNDWVQAWTNYVKAGKVVGYGGLNDAAQKLKQHSSNQAPVLEMASQASRNTAGEDPGSKIFQPVQWVSPPEITDKFVGPNNQAYILALAALQSAVDSLKDRLPASDTDLAAALQKAKDAEATVGQIALNFKTDSPVQGMVQKLLMDPIVYVEPYLKPPPPGADLNKKGGELCKQMAGVLNKYPFNPRGQDASLQEVSALFRPKDGLLWQFVDANLSKLLTRQGSQYSEIPGSPVKISPTFLAWLNRAAKFEDVAFQGGAQDPKLPYTVKSLPSPDIDFVKWVVDGQTAQFPGDNPQAKPFAWPGPGPEPHVVQLILKFKGGSETLVNKQDGLWGVFRLVEQADRRPSLDVIEESLGAGSPKQVSTDLASGHLIKVSVEIMADPPIFRPGYFAGLSCVSGVALK